MNQPSPVASQQRIIGVTNPRRRAAGGSPVPACQLTELLNELLSSVQLSASRVSKAGVLSNGSVAVPSSVSGWSAWTTTLGPGVAAGG
jgi:hypothetical protein